MSPRKALRDRHAIQAMPVVAMGLVVMLLGVLLWLLHRNEVEEEKRVLIQDILWVEQNLHFHLSSGVERLEQLADLAGRDGGPHSGEFGLQGRALIATSPEIERIIVRDADGAVLHALPPSEAGGAAGGDPQWPASHALARLSGRPVYGPPFTVEGKGARFEVEVPVFRGGHFAGTVAGVFSLDSMLARHVPWWFAQAYRLEIIDANGALVAAKSQLSPSEPGASYSLRFEPPGHGLELVAIAYHSDPQLLRNVLAAAIFILSILSLSSLWALRRHVRRRLAAEQALRTEHSFRKAMEDSLTVGMRARDLEGRITYVNPAFCHMVGWTAEELVGTVPPMLYWVPEDLEHTYELHRAVLRGEAPVEGFELVFRRKNGERFNALIYEAPLIDSEGRHTGWMASVLDVTERKRAEELSRQHQEKLQHTARLITMGEMASTLAHELNQPLSAIASYAAGCLNRLSAGDARAEELVPPLTKLGAQAQRAGQIIRRIHDFVRKSEPMVVPCFLDEIIEGAVGFLEPDARKRGIRIDLDLALEPKTARPRVEADHILIEQVILNLVRNAMEAMGQTPRAQRILSISLQSRDGQARLRVADRGSGIAPEVASNLFSPFFTTKEAGMGMGLNICRSIVEAHRGHLWFEPNPEGGSIFLFTLPEMAG
ncbi:C4-dicarboxylate transport sensor protein dctS [Paramagnetospirillum caucaseum]|uniref:histidine kinase n=1 Tax=Paramagnetospirillum caucaseum TaxID=1244869 RepID=M2Z6Y3_9PROT|nr:PAS domain S-box protein [Paramagnetospirillum caucaseum]EME70070.1 C4-dicarboxylate transport sensor protein dctS [Paramagnetospirillum caucaseum]